MSYNLPYLKQLEAESIFIIREAFAQFENPAILFSGGKDSIVLVHLCRKAFYPSRIPFPLVHIDTGHNFLEAIDFRDYLVDKLGVKLVVGYVEDSIKEGKVTDEKGINSSRNVLQTVTLLDTIEKYKFDAALGGARRDEEKARAKERFFSHRDEFGQWDPKNQRPELWQLFNGKKHQGEHFRVFPLSNWTELDVWNYIKQENLELPSIYFSHIRSCFKRDNVILAYSDFMVLKDTETPVDMTVRFRTVGDMTCTGAVLSKASTIDEIIHEIEQSSTTERGTRFDDQRSEAAMEDRKKSGYF
ncbi:MAG: sulfate adenylyltransferase subunit CysD [Bacteroidetes bacterium]|nr:sulfate adenylyltransferase subunit CysD [Bacteroidota bacterium]